MRRASAAEKKAQTSFGASKTVHKRHEGHESASRRNPLARAGRAGQMSELHPRAYTGGEPRHHERHIYLDETGPLLAAHSDAR